MKIALLSKSFLTPAVGGMELHAAWLAQMLMTQGHDVWVLTAAGVPPSERSTAQTLTVDAPPTGWSKAWFSGTEKLVKQLRPDLVIGESTAASHLAAAWPSVTHLHGNHWTELSGTIGTWGRRRMRFAVKRSAQLFIDYARWQPRRIAAGEVVALTAKEATAARMLYGIDNRNLHVVGNSVSSAFRPTAEKRSPTIVFAGRLDPSKGPDTVLRAYAASPPARAHYSLHFAGEGPLRAQLTTLATELGIARQTVFHGQLTQEQLAYLLGRAEIACFPSRRPESFSIGVLQAMASGCALIGSRAARIDQIAKHPMVAPLSEASGLTVTPNAAASWAQVLTTICGDAAKRESLGRQAAQVASHFSEECVSHELLKVYEQAAMGR